MRLDVGHFLSCLTPIVDLYVQSPQRNATRMGISRASRLRRGYQFVPELHTPCVACAGTFAHLRTGGFVERNVREYIAGFDYTKTSIV